MSTRRRIGVSAATTEAARRQLMQPVPCWEKAWVVPPNAAPGSTVKIFTWIKTEKVQQFSDDEGEADEPLAPLPDEPEAVDGDEDMEQDEVVVTGPEAPQADALEPATLKDLPSKPTSPKLQPLSMTSEAPLEETADSLDASLKPLNSSIDAVVDIDDKLNEVGGIELDISALGPDGTAFEMAADLSQLDADDALMGAPMMEQAIDPFADTLEESSAQI